jgi:DMSO/TMAO reductase YedYZ molybdopterin-dependent catalytic subunit
MSHPSRPADGWERFARARRGPLASGAFPSRLHGERSAALLGIALGIAFTICFLTGLMSHFIQRGPREIADAWPSRPVSLYRVTQGIHVLTGMLAVPLLLAKMWVAYPRLWTWPPVRNPFHAIERLALVALVGGALFQLATGLLNVFYWYLFPFNFAAAHYAGAWIAIGGLIVHVGAKWEAARRGLRRAPAPASVPAEAPAGLSRRSFLTVVGAASGTILALTAGAAVPPLSRLALLAPRREGLGPQGVPVNHTAPPAVLRAAQSPDYRLAVDGAVARPATYALADLRALRQVDARLPISCVEGWSTNASWRGVRVRDLLDRAGADPGARVLVESIQTHGGSHRSILNSNHARDPLTLLAMELNGEPLHIDHGYPVRLIAPNRPGTQQTKWVARLTVL